MKSLKATPLNILEFNPNTLSEIRKTFDLDQPGRIDEAINILEEWIKKQDHFVTKDFDRDYLERLIIINKGLLERAKIKLDKICTLRTLIPEYFKPYNLKEDFEDLKDVHAAVMPKLTRDNCRIYLISSKITKMTSQILDAACKRLIIFAEFLNQYDYSAGYEIIYDLRYSNVADIGFFFDVTTMRKLVSIWLEGYGFRVKAIHLITESKMIDILVAVLRQVLSSKIMGRFYIHKNLDDLHKCVQSELLPAEYGGKENSILEIHQKWTDVLSSSDYIEHLKKLGEMRTDETLRKVDQFNDQHFGTPGTFRTLVVD